MTTMTEAGNYQSFQADSGRWYFHPVSQDWLTFNGNTEFSRSYSDESAALEAAEFQEQLDDSGIDGPIAGASGVYLP